MNFLDRLKKAKEVEENEAEERAGLNSLRFSGEKQPRSRKLARRQVVMDIVPPRQESAETPPIKKPEKNIEAPRPKPDEYREDWQETPGPDDKLGSPSVTLNKDIPIKTWEPEGLKRTRVKKRMALALAALAAAASFILPTFIFPKFSISIFPKIYSVSVPPLELTAAANVKTLEPASKKIPSIAVEVEKTISREYESSGTKFLRDKSQGTIEIFNAFSSSPQTLVTGTRFQDPSGKIFRLEKGVIITGAGVEEGKIIPTSVKAKVAADAPGESYNIEPSEFRIPGFRGTPKYQGFYAKSAEKFGGGFEGQARVVTADDLKRASEDTTKVLSEELRLDLEKRIPADPDLLAPPGGREIAVLELAGPRAGDRFDRFTITASGRGRLTAVRNSHIAQVLGALLITPAADDSVKFPNDQNKLSIAAGKSSAAPGELRLVLSGELDYWREINIGNLAETLRTSTPKKSEAYLRGREEIKSFELKRFPRWLWFISQRPGGLEIDLQKPE